jgi:hypothetical protein
VTPRRRYWAIPLAVAILVPLPLQGLQAPATTRPTRVLQIGQSFALEGVDLLITITEGRTWTSGEMVATSGSVNRPGIEKQYGCRTAPQQEEARTWSCQVPFRSGQPNWARLLRQLDALGVMNPPSDSLLTSRAGRLGHLCLDGTPWTLRIRDSTETLLVDDRQSCGPIGSVRKRFEAGLEGVIDSVNRRASLPS